MPLQMGISVAGKWRPLGGMMTVLRATGTAAVFALLATGAMAQDAAAPPFIDEIRLGVSGSIQVDDIYEPGPFPWVTLYFDPFERDGATNIGEQLLRPRLNVGAMVSTTGEASQLLAGATWTVDLTESLFVEVGLGGAFTNASLDGSDPGPQVGCSLLFHESIAAGVRIDQHWSVVATVEHSSNANLCDENDGLTYAGIGIGYRF